MPCPCAFFLEQGWQASTLLKGRINHPGPAATWLPPGLSAPLAGFAGGFRRIPLAPRRADLLSGNVTQQTYCQKCAYGDTGINSRAWSPPLTTDPRRHRPNTPPGPRLSRHGAGNNSFSLWIRQTPGERQLKPIGAQISCRLKRSSFSRLEQSEHFRQQTSKTATATVTRTARTFALTMNQ